MNIKTILYDNLPIDQERIIFKNPEFEKNILDAMEAYAEFKTNLKSFRDLAEKNHNHIGQKLHDIDLGEHQDKYYGITPKHACMQALISRWGKPVSRMIEATDVETGKMSVYSSEDILKFLEIEDQYDYLTYMPVKAQVKKVWEFTFDHGIYEVTGDDELAYRFHDDDGYHFTVMKLHGTGMSGITLQEEDFVWTKK